MDNLLLEFDSLFLNLCHRPRQRHVHVGVGIFCRQCVVSPVNDDLSDLAILLYVNDYMST